MKITKSELVELNACRDGLKRFIKQTAGVEIPVDVAGLVGGENTYGDLLWLAGKKLPKDLIVRFACDCALINIKLIKPYTDKYDLIVQFLTDPTTARAAADAAYAAADAAYADADAAYADAAYAAAYADAAAAAADADAAYAAAYAARAAADAAAAAYADAAAYAAAYAADAAATAYADAAYADAAYAGSEEKVNELLRELFA